MLGAVVSFNTEASPLIAEICLGKISDIAIPVAIFAITV
jgi:hypothetical protein